MVAKPPTSDFNTVQKKWNELGESFRSAGVPDTAWLPVAKQDITNVADKDEYGMSNDEISDAVVANATGKNPITESPRHSGGVLGDLGTVASNILPDISHTITAAPRGIADLAKQLVSPSSYTTIADALKENPNGQLTPDVAAIYKKAGVNPADSSSFSDHLKLLAATPLLGSLPGISDLATADQPGGKTQILEHPVSSLLDVGPAVIPASEAAGTALGGLTREDAATIASQRAEAGLAPADNLGKSPASALAQAHPVKAAARAVDQTALARLTSGSEFTRNALEEGLTGPGQSIADTVAKKSGIAKSTRAFNAMISREDRVKLHEASNVTEDLYQSAGNLSPEEQASAASIMKTDPNGYDQLNPEQAAWWHRVTAEAQSQQSKALADTDPTDGKPYLADWTDENGVHYVKPRTSAIARANARKTSLADLRERRAAKLSDAESTLQSRNSDLYTDNYSLRRYGENRANTPAAATSANPTTPAGMESPGRIDSATVRTPQDIAATLAPFTDMFTRVNPDSLISGESGADTDLERGLAQARGLPGAAAKPIISSAMILSGGDTSYGGLVSRLTSALNDGDVAAARSTLAAMDRLMSKASRVPWDSIPALKSIHDYTKELRTELTAFSAKANRDSVRTRAAINAAKQYRAAKSKADRTTERFNKAVSDYRRESFASPPENLQPFIRERLRQNVIDAANRNADVDPDGHLAQLKQLGEWDKVIQEIKTTPTMATFENFVGKDETTELYHDAVTEALHLASEGFDPIYTHQIGSAALDRVVHVRMISDRERTPAQYKDSAFNLSDSTMNVTAELSQAALNVLSRDAVRDLYNNGIKVHLQRGGDLFQSYVDRASRLESAGKSRHFASTQQHAVYLMSKEWSPFDFAAKGMKADISAADLLKPDQQFLPKHLATQLSSWLGRGDNMLEGTGAQAAYNAAMRTFRLSVLYGPRHLAHVVIGGLMPLLLDNPMSLLQMNKTFSAMEGDGILSKLANGGTFKPGSVLNSDISRMLAQPSNYRPEDTISFYTGRTYANLLKKYWDATGGKVSEKLEQVESLAQNLYRGSRYLSALKSGADPMAALEAARRISMDLDDFAPAERTIMKQIMPFYSFTRFATKFLFQLPFDHPVRVAIISRASNQAQEEWGTGLPQKMMSLFFIGTPDANGNITTIDTKNLNPFRSIANSFTLQGFISSLNPAVGALFSATGMDTLSGTGELYPSLTFDANTGDLTVKRPADSLTSAVSSFIPEVGGVQSLIQASEGLRNTASTNKGSFLREIYNDFNIPFAVSQYNIPQVRINTAENAYSAAKSASDYAVGHNNFTGDVNRFSLLPNAELTGTTGLYTPEQLRQQTAALYSGVPSGIDPLAFQLTQYG